MKLKEAVLKTKLTNKFYGDMLKKYTTKSKPGYPPGWETTDYDEFNKNFNEIKVPKGDEQFVNFEDLLLLLRKNNIKLSDAKKIALQFDDQGMNIIYLKDGK